ncbi:MULTISPECIES: hypothetical protein [Chryseobacterium]|uniref:Uncharacterized protein n=1 Tax=Chryseobacterium indologenes TaxID=253 RepID=A0AAD0YXJ7_CHRID|nr:MULTISPECIES: hypothetical protein [Chryseobacterium]ASE61030.1 hypothetical protein CEQ15_05710 [Chryseobacterium indologenes]ATN05112.1 hypothetical protein CRN76_06685 [Chryseobacterium indologenes]AYY86136.1 hypothetical protein EGX91_17065 [Chryseobacterium indologenes]AZB16689.1 hypothetical protein EG352_02320 [Chryseobacterium indologenes]QIX83037.1 hypothetical protein FOB56_18100 [Chryseobacterium indologenes]
MKKLLLMGLFGFLSVNMYAQEETDTYNGQKYGYIIDQSGKKIEGVVRLNGSSVSPWQNQLKVKFAAVADIDKVKNRIKYKTYDADEIKEYMIYEGDNPRIFKAVKYSNTREALIGSESSTGIGAGFKALNNLSRTSQFAELVMDGKITVYKLYGYPTSVTANTAYAISQAEADRLINNPNYIYSKKGGKAEELTPSKAKIIIADCPYAKGKMAKGEYGSLKNEEKKRTGLGKFIRDEISNTMTDKLSLVNEVIYDYNENCK